MGRFLIDYILFIGLTWILLPGLGVYLIWAIVGDRHRPTRATRKLLGRVDVVLAIPVFACLLAIPMRIAWVTRIDAIPGSYEADGTWGTATLSLKPDGTFVEGWNFINAYDVTSESRGCVKGTWRAGELNALLKRDLYLYPFKGLFETDKERAFASTLAKVKGYSGSTAIELSGDSHIVFWKKEMVKPM